MLRLLIAGAVLALAGCAAPRTMEQDIAAASNIDLCEAFMFGPQHLSDATRPEVHRRNLNCRDMEQAIAYRQQLRMQAASRPMPTSTPYYLPPPPGTGPQTTCTSRVIGNQVQTVCR